LSALVAAGWALGLPWHLAWFDPSVLAIALVAARYGFAWGALAGLAAGLLHLFASGTPPLAFFDLTLARAGLPQAIAVTGLGMVVGLMGDTQRQAIRQARSEGDELAARLFDLSNRYGVLTAAKEALDRRIVGQVQSISAMYEAAKNLEVLDPEAVVPAMLQLVQRFTEAEALSLYELEGFRLLLRDSLGEVEDRPATLVVDDGPVGMAVRSGKSMGVRTRSEYQRSRALLVAPYRHADGRVRGVVVIERIPFSSLTLATAQLLDLIADWFGRALSKSEAYAWAKEQQIAHPVTGIHRSAYILERLNQEWGIAKRYKLPLSVILVRQPSLLDEEPEHRAEAALPLVTDLQRRVRVVDLLAHYRTDDSFLLVLPITPQSGAQVLASRIQESRPGLVIAVASNEGEADSPEGLLQVLQVLAFDLQEA
jgi:GAF domain-containing protein